MSGAAAQSVKIELRESVRSCTIRFGTVEQSEANETQVQDLPSVSI